MRRRANITTLAAWHGDRTALRLLLLLGLGVAYAGFARFSARRRVPVLCPFRRLTGVRCPLCGFTTATARVLDGDLREATRAHPLALPALVAAVGWYLAAVGALALNHLLSRREA